MSSSMKSSAQMRATRSMSRLLNPSKTTRTRSFVALVFSFAVMPCPLLYAYFSYALWRRQDHRAEAVSGERLPPPLLKGDLGQRLARFLPLADRRRRVAEGEDGHHVKLGGDAEEGFHLLLTAKADPVPSDALGPGGK